MDTREVLSARYESELAQIHSRPVESWTLPEFQPVFSSYCRLGGRSEASYDCAWGVLAGGGASGDVAYLASRGEGDDVLARMSCDRLNAALVELDRYYGARAVCDG